MIYDISFTKEIDINEPLPMIWTWEMFEEWVNQQEGDNLILDREVLIEESLDRNIQFNVFKNIDLKKLTIKCDSLYQHKMGLFNRCSDIESIQLGNIIVNNASHMFADCTSLQSLDLSNATIKGLANYMFANCTALNNLKLGNILSNNGNRIFAYCFSSGSNTITVQPKSSSNNIYVNEDNKLVTPSTTFSKTLTPQGNNTYTFDGQLS